MMHVCRRASGIALEPIPEAVHVPWGVQWPGEALVEPCDLGTWFLLGWKGR